MSLRILVPYDGSEPAEGALEYALEAFPDGHLTVLHVVEPFPDHGKAGGHAARRSEQVFEAARGVLDRATERAADHAGSVETELRYGRPIHLIPRYVESHGIEEVVMGSHGRDGAARLLIGSVAETVVRRVSVPVTVVPPIGDAGKHARPGRVLVPFDGSACSRNALEYAIERFQDASLTALYVIHPRADEGDVLESHADLAKASEGDGSEADRVLSMATLTADRFDSTVDVSTERGDPNRRILEWVEGNEVDHVVIGCHGREGIARLVLGSVAETTVRRVDVPVTAVS